MRNDLPPELRNEELERHAYNAAFYELGLRWHWDSATYAALLGHSPHAQARIRHYLEKHQPHLLKAYDANALARVIQERMEHHWQPTARPFDWAQMVGCELGV